MEVAALTGALLSVLPAVGVAGLSVLPPPPQATSDPKVVASTNKAKRREARTGEGSLGRGRNDMGVNLRPLPQRHGKRLCSPAALRKNPDEWSDN
jgi:hypothetical protein